MRPQKSCVCKTLARGCCSGVGRRDFKARRRDPPTGNRRRDRAARKADALRSDIYMGRENARREWLASTCRATDELDGLCKIVIAAHPGR